MKFEISDEALIEAFNASERMKRLERFSHLCIRIGIRDKYALDHGVIDEEEMTFIHDMLTELVPDIFDKKEGERKERGEEISRFIGKTCCVKLKDGRELLGRLSCDSRYLHITDTETGEPNVFYGKDVVEIEEA